MHTKGPWMAAARPSSVVGWPVVSPAAMGRSICNVTVGHEDSEDNARLIAAAPDLLEALKGCLDGLEILSRANPKHKGIKQDIAVARAAIAKATGAEG